MAALTVTSYSLCPLTRQIGLWWWVIFNTTTIWHAGERENIVKVEKEETKGVRIGDKKGYVSWKKSRE